ncbi:MAG: putative bifunctional diguanylate cyclase/phosphodiesterase [Acetivibrionales bacterium]
MNNTIKRKILGRLLAGRSTLKKSSDYYINHDFLTGLPNKTSLMEKLSLCIKECEKNNTVVIVTDIDHYDLINDTLGRSFTDELLKLVAKRLNRIFGSGNVFKMDRDEFAIIYNHNSKKELTDTIESAAEQLKKPHEIRRSKMHINMRMGVVSCRYGDNDPHHYLNRAEIALREAKTRGKTNYLIYNEELGELLKEQMYIEGLLHKALENHEFEIYYQPQMIVESGKISGFEALIRWNSPELGSVNPDRFIRIAEENHLIVPIGEWLLRNACRFIKSLHKQGCGKLSISVNVSVVQLMHEGFENTVPDILNEVGLSPEYLELEITETILAESYESIKEKLLRLKNLGVKMAMDDFGKGYSSLGVLSRLPIHTLKIDKLFMENLMQDSPKRFITDLVIQIGNKMGFDVLAEGVETMEQLEYLKKYDNIKAQGYYFSRPVTKERAEEMVRKHYFMSWKVCTL